MIADPNLAYTVFAPTDEAFTNALTALNLTAEEVLASPELTPILQNHLLAYPLKVIISHACNFEVHGLRVFNSTSLRLYFELLDSEKSCLEKLCSGGEAEICEHSWCRALI